jgi:hypothetical protein
MALTKISGSILKDPLNLGHVSIGGTLTYQDVTNVDSVGVITARTGIDIVAGDLVIPESIIHRGDTDTSINFPAADTITLETAGSQRVRVDASGVVIVATGAARTYVDGAGNTQTPKVQIEDNANSNTAIVLRYNSGAGSANRRASFMFARTADGSAVSDNSVLGEVLFLGEGNNTLEKAASIRAEVDGTPGTTDMPGRLIFSTTADNANTTTERLRITSGGNLRLGLNSVAEQTDSAHYIMTLTGKSGQTGAGAIAFKDPSANTDGFIFADSGNLFITADYSNATADSSIIFRVDGSSEKLRIKSDGTVVFNSTINSIHTNSNDSKLVLFGGSTNSVSNGGVLSLHGITNSSGNYTDLSAGAGGYIQFRSGTSEKFRITAGGEVLCGVTSTGTDPTKNITLHAGSMMRVSNFYVGRVHGSANNGNGAIVLHRLGQNQGFQMSGGMTFHSYTGSAYLSGSIVSRYNNDAVSRDVSLQKANSGMNLQLVTGTISGVSGNYLAIKKNGGGTGVCYLNGFFGGNIESHGGIREIANGDWTTTTVHGSGITGSNDSASS